MPNILRGSIPLDEAWNMSCKMALALVITGLNWMYPMAVLVLVQV